MMVNLGHLFTASSFHYEHPENEDFSPLKIMLGRRKFPFETGPFSQGTTQFLHFQGFVCSCKHMTYVRHGSIWRFSGSRIGWGEKQLFGCHWSPHGLGRLLIFKFSQHVRGETSSWRRKNAEKMRRSAGVVERHAWSHHGTPRGLGGGFSFNDHPLRYVMPMMGRRRWEVGGHHQVEKRWLSTNPDLPSWEVGVLEESSRHFWSHKILDDLPDLFVWGPVLYCSICDPVDGLNFWTWGLSAKTDGN